jgi:ribosomal protein S18 acetylase RimI-like enzyme
MKTMSTSDIQIKFVTSWPEEEIVKLYKAGGWWEEHYDPSVIKYLIQGSFCFAVVIDNTTDKTIGMGRVLSDRISDGYIQDLVILPEYRNKGIGRKLTKSLVEYCLQKGVTWIALISEPNQDAFYKKIGFKVMKNYVPLKYGGL